VGQKGVRVQAIIAEFNGLEKIDIIQWQDNPKEYIIQALSPAKNLNVEIDEKELTAKVKVPQEELSLAIGKDGQNVRLASKLTGYRIEIEGDETMISTLAPKEEFKPKEEKAVTEEAAPTKPAEATDASEEKDLATAEVAEDLEKAVEGDTSEEPVELKQEESVNEPLVPENPDTDAKDEVAEKVEEKPKS
jgi:N utilization substance protein A